MSLATGCRAPESRAPLCTSRPDRFDPSEILPGVTGTGEVR